MKNEWKNFCWIAQTPRLTCPKVAQKMRMIESARRTTVSRRETKKLRTCRTRGFIGQGAWTVRRNPTKAGWEALRAAVGPVSLKNQVEPSKGTIAPRMDFAAGSPAVISAT